MPTNEEMRRASGQAMVNNRRAIGQSMEDQRRAGGQAMIAQRTGTAVAADINRLTQPQQSRKTLKPVPSVGALPASQGRGVYKPPAATGTGGIASPLVELTTVVNGVTVPDRDYWPGGLLSSDGLFVLPSIKTLNLIDANNAEVQIQLAAPAGS
ncbi:hypothetical protein CXF92_18500 [Pseudomonas sp. Choline-3u-10]|nr:MULTISPECIES: hypothetical protein [Pseudomonadaceae]PKG90909.1 hypothetical protein CXF92_18500 [Pseudomonas sp. Choline-3u-10]